MYHPKVKIYSKAKLKFKHRGKVEYLTPDEILEKNMFVLKIKIINSIRNGDKELFWFWANYHFTKYDLIYYRDFRIPYDEIVEIEGIDVDLALRRLDMNTDNHFAAQILPHDWFDYVINYKEKYNQFGHQSLTKYNREFNSDMISKEEYFFCRRDKKHLVVNPTDFNKSVQTDEHLSVYTSEKTPIHLIYHEDEIYNVGYGHIKQINDNSIDLVLLHDSHDEPKNLSFKDLILLTNMTPYTYHLIMDCGRKRGGDIYRPMLDPGSSMLQYF